MRGYDSLRRQGEFTRLYRRGRRHVQPQLLVYHVERHPMAMPRVGIAIGKAIGNAVKRNLIRRQLQNTLDTLDLKHAGNLDLLIVAKTGAAELSYQALALQLRAALREPLVPQRRKEPAPQRRESRST